jgi:hypothetical protein
MHLAKAHRGGKTIRSWNVAMKFSRGLLVACLAVALAWPLSAPVADAQTDEGLLTMNPGQVHYLSFGICGVNDLLNWAVWGVTPNSSGLMISLQKPDGIQVGQWVGEYAGGYGTTTDQAGEWKLGLALDASAPSSISFSYVIYHFVISFSVDSPVNNGYSNSNMTCVYGSSDGPVTMVDVSVDNVTFTRAQLDPAFGDWSAFLQLSPGSNTIYARAQYWWWNFTRILTALPVTVTLDVTPPTVMISAPSDGSHWRDSYVEVAWQASDNIGIAKTVLWDEHSRIEVQGNSSRFRVSSGHHVLYVEVTDVAGNKATSSVAFGSDSRALSFDGPYYGMPTIVIIAGVILGWLLVASVVRKKRREPALLPPQEPNTPL